MEDQSKLTQPVTDDGFTSLIVPAKLGCKHPLDICNLLIKKDIIDAEKHKSLTNIKPKHDLVDIYRANLRAEAEKNEAKRPPVIQEHDMDDLISLDGTGKFTHKSTISNNFIRTFDADSKRASTLKNLRTLKRKITLKPVAIDMSATLKVSKINENSYSKLSSNSIQSKDIKEVT